MNVADIAKMPLVLLLAACSSTGGSAPAAGSSAPAGSAGTSAAAVSAEAAAVAASGLQMAPLQDGYQRFIAPAVTVPAGTTDDWIQWVSGPTDQDYDVIALKGAQSKGGHHALMLSISEANQPGFTRKYTERDQLTSSSLGGIGAEGDAQIPEGVVFRLRKGSYLAIQSHYLNVTEKDIQGETYIDIKLTPRDPANTVAGHFASTSLMISLAPKAETTQEVYCKVEQDLHILRMTNHMHYAGVSTFTEYTDAAGMTHMLKRDDVWSEDWALTPNYDNFSAKEPLLIPAGSMLHTQCRWNNTADKTLAFPEEMCVFATVILGEKEIACIDGKFNVRSAAPASAAAGSDAAAAPSGAAAGSGAAGSNGPSAAGSGAAGAAAAVSGACTSTEDRAILNAPEFQDKQRSCGSMCFGAADSCATECLAKNTALSAGCAACNGAQISCAMMHCVADCTGGFMSASCMPCLETSCGAEYHACAGL